MIRHIDLGDTAYQRGKNLKLLIDSKQVQFGGNAKLKIYGLLNCRAGKRMQVNNRVFFTSEEEAIATDYRPCGHCMKDAYIKWKALL